MIAIGKRVHCWRGFAGRSASCFAYGFVFQVFSEKYCIAKTLQGIWEGFLFENNRNIVTIISTNLVANSLLSCFFFFFFLFVLS